MPLSQRGVTPFLLLRANACRRRSTTVNERPTTKEGRGRKKRGESAALYVCTRVIRKRQPPRATRALSSKNKQNVAPRYGLTRVYIARIADIAGRFSLVLSFSLAVIPFHLSLLLLSLLILSSPSPCLTLARSLSLSLIFSPKKLGLVHVRARGEICCTFHANNSEIAKISPFS